MFPLPSTLKPKYIQVTTIIALLVTLLFTHGLAYKLGEILETTQASQVQTQLIAENNVVCSQQTDELSTKLEYCYQNRASQSEPTVSFYDVATFGIDSPLLNHRPVTTQTFSYNQSEIMLQWASLADRPDTANVAVWLLKEGNIFKTFTLPGQPPAQNASQLLTDFPIFVGYENRGQPVFISDLAKTWQLKDSYVSPTGERYFFHYNEVPHAIGSVSLSHYSTFSAIGGPILIQVTVPVTGEDTVTEISDPAVAKAKEELKSVVETLDFRVENLVP
jgi:hypothetical protein